MTACYKSDKIMGKLKNKKTQGQWEFFDKKGNLRHLGNWYRRYKQTRTTERKHKQIEIE